MNQPHRDQKLEGLLQTALDGGRNVWAVGDIHGCRQTFEELLAKLRLSEEDQVVCLGDLIDRGPDSDGVLRIVRDCGNIHSLKGNHEEIMSRAIGSPSGRTMEFWLRIGGRETLESMSTDSSKRLGRASEWLSFTNSLPTEVVLDTFRLVHAGYDPASSPDDQSDKERLSSRTIFLAQTPLDPARQIVCGHTPVQKLVDFGLPSVEEGVWTSDIQLDDGRPSVLLIDTGAVLESGAINPRLTAYNLYTGKIKEVPRHQCSAPIKE